MAMKPFLLFSSMLIASAALAQAPPSPATPPARTAPPSPERAANCAPMQPRSNAGTAVPDGTATTGQRAEPLGDKLARSDGVLCPPPGVDPDMHAAPSDLGKMPVIPPPGSPGGDPTIRPK